MRKLLGLLAILAINGQLFAKSNESTEQTKAMIEINQEIERFSNALAQIKLFYINDIPYKQLITNSLKGMTTRLDPHSDYLSENEWHNLNTEINGEFVGIGVSVIPEEGMLRVISPTDNSPAKLAGIQSNDIIFKVDNSIISQIGIENAMKQIHGKPNSIVKISTFRPSTKEIKQLQLKREKIDAYPVTKKIINNNLTYIRIPLFSEKTAAELKQALKTEKAEGLIIDLRDNPGGTLSAAVDVSDLFLDSNKTKNNKDRNGSIVEIKGRIKDYDTKFMPHPGAILKNTPIVVLVNHGSASASEIVAGALSSYHRAIVIGTNTFGKGSVQTVLPNNGAALKITTALYYLPNNKTIQGSGVSPDIFVKQVNVPKTNEEQSMLELINEASLNNSIKASKKDTADQMLNSEEIDELAHTDFQLYQAAKVLETVVLERTKSSL